MNQLRTATVDGGQTRVLQAESRYRPGTWSARAKPRSNARSEVREAYSMPAKPVRHCAVICATRWCRSRAPFRGNLLRYNGMLIGRIRTPGRRALQISSVNAAIEAQRDFCWPTRSARWRWSARPARLLSPSHPPPAEASAGTERFHDLTTDFSSSPVRSRPPA